MVTEERDGSLPRVVRHLKKEKGFGLKRAQRALKTYSFLFI